MCMILKFSIAYRTLNNIKSISSTIPTIGIAFKHFFFDVVSRYMNATSTDLRNYTVSTASKLKSNQLFHFGNRY